MRIRAMVWVVLTLVISVSGLGYAQAPDSPMVEAPRIKNRAELLAAVREHYPLHLRKKGIGGAALVRLFVDTSGAADSLQITSGTGVPELDTAALEIAGKMEFEPARVGGEPRGLWLELPVTMQPPARIGSPSVDFIELENREEILEAVRENIPEALRAERFVFDSELWVQIDANGRVFDVDFERSTCVEDTDRIVYHLAHAFQFRPADGYEGPIDGWTTLKVTLDPFPGEMHHPVELEGARARAAARRAAARDSVAAVQDSLAAASPGAVVEEEKPESVYIPPSFVDSKMVESEITRLYSTELLSAGIGGQVELTVWLDDSGQLHKQKVSTSSGWCQLDLIALEIGKSIEYVPAKRDGRPTKAVVSFPITFK